MTRTHALKRLLEHGPMDRRDLIDITGWKPRQLESALDELMYAGIVLAVGKVRHRLYMLS
jgi:DNA-binding MarR family transcriptional regulator